MKQLRHSKLTAVIAALLTVTAISVPLAPTLLALADQIYTYGEDGRPGRSGRDGYDGRPGRSQSGRAEGSPIQINAAGEAGQDGEAGARGERPVCPAQPYDVRYHLQAPDGGAGGAGGAGGTGGQGGEVTLYYTDLSQLRQVFVDAGGGRGGRGGRGGVGAAGCRCDDRSWRVEVCRDGNCEEERYSCRDGDVGHYGRDGRQGTSGEIGQVWLINRAEPLLGEQPHYNQPLELFLQQPVGLSRHVWEARSGVGALLAAGSVVNDTYQQYIGRLEARVQLDWQAPRSLTPFISISPSVTLLETGEVQLDFPDVFWVESSISRTDTLTTVTIEQVSRADDVLNLAWGIQTGQGTDFAVTVVDLGRESAYVNTQFELTYRTTDDDPRDNRRVRYEEQFSGPIPSDIVTQEQNRFVLNLGQLPISNRYFRPGTQVQMELRIVRSLGQNSADRILEWQGQL